MRCPGGHSFDIARQGYVNLLGRAAPANADTAEMLEARARFLAAGHYLPITRALAERVSGARRIVEAGAGTAWYLARCLDAEPGAQGLATDVSAAAAKRAARSHPSAAAIVADTWAGLPIRSEVADVVLCVFAPRNAAEFARILAPQGRLLVVVPTPEHLVELRERYGLLGVSADKPGSLMAAFPGWELADRLPITASLDLAADQVADLIAMGPNAFHQLPSVTSAERATLAVEVLTLRRSPETDG